MTQIEQMIKDMCPYGVEWKQLGEVATLSRGKVYSKEYLRDNAGEYPVYSSQTANNGELGKINTYDYDGRFLTWTTDGAYAGTVFRREGKFSITNVCGLISKVDKSLSIDFLYYWLNKVAKGYVYQGMGNPKLMSNVMETIEIPIPPLEIQERIVAILDRFSALAAELQAELQMRRKQYEYYRTQLLTPHSDCNSATKPDDCNWVTKTLGDVCDIKNGKDYKHLNDGKYPVYGSGGIMTYKDQYVYDKPSILLPRKGSIGKIHYVDVPFWNVDTAFYTVIDENQVLPKYLFYYLSTIDLEAYNTGTGAIPSLTQTVLKTLEVSFPSLKEQARIVEILDKFEKLTTSLSDGIPAEQAAQQKRYEYYRDLLLTFDRKAE